MSRQTTSAGALKGIIENAGLRLSAYRDQLPRDCRLPAVAIDEDVTTIPERDGDTQDPTGDHGESELLNVHLFQPFRDRNRKAGERFDLARALTTALRVAPPFVYGPDDAPVRVYGLRVDGRARIIEGAPPSKGEPDNRIVHHVLTITMRRDA